MSQLENFEFELFILFLILNVVTETFQHPGRKLSTEEIPLDQGTVVSIRQGQGR